jgi:hypothetical protein
MESTAIIRQTGSAVGQAAGRRRGQAKPAEKRTSRANGNGFLNHAFLPVWACRGNPERMQKKFFSSLANLCKYYDLTTPALAGAVFPQNIYKAWQDVEGKLRRKGNNLHCMIVQDKKCRSVLAVAETCNMGYDLFYIPVRAYWKWAQSAGYSRVAELVSVIFAYLYQVVEIPFYADNFTYMNGQYDTLQNWVLDEERDEENKEDMEFFRLQQDTLYELFQAGAHIAKEISNPELLRNMEKVVLGFQHRDEAELELEFLGVEFLTLYQKYPNISLSSCTRPDMVYPVEDDRISPEMYTAFYWSAKDCFADELHGMISNDFNEIGIIDEPVTVRTFEKMPVEEKYELDFAKDLFGLMEKLAGVLIKYDYEEHHGRI